MGLGEKVIQNTLICKLINMKMSVLLFPGMISVLWLKDVRVFEWQSVHGTRETRLVKKCGVFDCFASFCMS